MLNEEISVNKYQKKINHTVKPVLSGLVLQTVLNGHPLLSGQL